MLHFKRLLPVLLISLIALAGCQEQTPVTFEEAAVTTQETYPSLSTDWQIESRAVHTDRIAGSAIINGSFEAGLPPWTTVTTSTPFRPWSVSGAGLGGGCPREDSDPTGRCGCPSCDRWSVRRRSRVTTRNHGRERPGPQPPRSECHPADSCRRQPRHRP